MNENEQLARWMGLRVREGDIQLGLSLFWNEYGKEWAPVPNFRTSNELAGAVLEKLAETQYIALTYDRPSKLWGCTTLENSHAKDWRSAVVDAALEVIRRSAIDKGG